ncbi:MAG: pyruvate dehydrogenase (acetyl-transferring) E1 component subunit alpha [Actinobacteria bacterium]|jgi:pyruvate dehydrogenase E1 component alpha subunit|nr:pyruvate dehydrogenase (acetyl-transferring) E1 component subunit alpha [Actinomycetota bacterium]|tara:strand:+ start:2934 stop:3923 length:990 start_codon:yes stop_codon:yes gene_type:complete
MIPKEKQVLMLERMTRIRQFEKALIESQKSGEIVGALHTYIGEEAVATGACVALNDDDYIAGNHRSHGHPIAKGGDINKAMAEIFGKKDGYCKGKGGSMHLADFSIGILGESGIVASSVPVATGAALASKLKGKNFISLVFFGDGASNQGACHESMNLAALWKLPVIFVCENNQFAVTTSYRDSVSVDHISDRASAYGMPGVLVDGQDALAMYEATSEAVKRARKGEGPTLIEGLTYRYEDHSLGLASVRRDSSYRTDEEVEEWIKRDPIEILKDNMISQKLITQKDFDDLEKKEIISVEKALNFARNSPFPEPEDLFDDLFTDPIKFA